MSSIAVYLRSRRGLGAWTAEARDRALSRWPQCHQGPLFIDHYSGKPGSVAEQSALRELQAGVFAGEFKTIVLYRLDRLARSIRDGINVLTDWLGAGVRVVVVTMQIDLSGALGQTVAALLLGLAQMEREAIRERQAAGIAAARARGKTWGGRKQGSFKVDPARVAELTAKGLTPTEIANALRCSERTVYRCKRSRYGWTAGLNQLRVGSGLLRRMPRWLLHKRCRSKATSVRPVLTGTSPGGSGVETTLEYGKVRQIRIASASRSAPSAVHKASSVGSGR